jgi:hypothetical protein
MLGLLGIHQHQLRKQGRMATLSNPENGPSSPATSWATKKVFGCFGTEKVDCFDELEK